MVAGERSGDVYGGELAAALQAQRPGLEVFGCGGEAMRRARVQTVVDAHQVTMLGITEIVAGLPRAYRAFRTLLEEVDRRQPRLAVLIDFPDFNLRLARRLKRRMIPVVYFVSPQIWAWRAGRIRQLKASVDKMLCIFDFEEALYRRAGIPVEYVGHPLVDLVRLHSSREEFFLRANLEPNTPLVALLPGSRKTEVLHNLPVMLDAAARLALSRPIQFVVAVAPTLEFRWLEGLVARCSSGSVPVRVMERATYDSLQHADIAVLASGTATLEAALRERPMVVVYRVSSLTWLLGKFLVDVPFYSMVNLLASKPLVPELIQSDFTATRVASQVEYLLDHREACREMVAGMRELKTRLGAPGAIRRAAEAVLAVLQET